MQLICLRQDLTVNRQTVKSVTVKGEKAFFNSYFNPRSVSYLQIQRLDLFSTNYSAIVSSIRWYLV